MLKKALNEKLSIWVKFYEAEPNRIGSLSIREPGEDFTGYYLDTAKKYQINGSDNARVTRLDVWVTGGVALWFPSKRFVAS